MLTRLLDALDALVHHPMHRLRCWWLGHWWAPYDLYSDRCICCKATRTMPVRNKPGPPQGEHP